MITHHIRKTKLLFGIGILALVLFIVFGSLSFKRNNALTRAMESFSRELRTIAYRSEYRRFAGIASANSLSTAAAPSLHESEAASLPVLLYHGIVGTSDRFSISRELFKDQLFVLKRAGYRTVTLDEARGFLESGAPLPERSFLLTFDDGRYDSFVSADPILKALDFRAVMFVATKPSLETTEDPHNKYYIDQADIARMIASGRWEIGSHGMQEHGGMVPIDAVQDDGEKGNFLSNRMWRSDLGRLETDAEHAQRVRREIAESKNILEATFGITVSAFSYPFGDWGQQTENAPGAAQLIRREAERSYEMAFRQVWQNDTEPAFNYPMREDAGALRRLEVDTLWSGAQLISFLEKGQAKALPYDDTLDENAGWKHAWGRVTVEDGALLLSATDTTSGAFAFLDGTRGWDDYRMTVRGERQRGSHVSLIARYQDGGNYAECLFSDEEVRIEQVVENKRSVLKKSALSKKMPNDNVALGVGVDGDTIACRIDGAVVAMAYTLSQRLSDGGIGVKIWDQTLGISALKLHSLEVSSLGTARVLEQ